MEKGCRSTSSVPRYVEEGKVSGCVVLQMHSSFQWVWSSEVQKESTGSSELCIKTGGRVKWWHQKVTSDIKKALKWTERLEWASKCTPSSQCVARSVCSSGAGVRSAWAGQCCGDEGWQGGDGGGEDDDAGCCYCSGGAGAATGARMGLEATGAWSPGGISSPEVDQVGSGHVEEQKVEPALPAVEGPRGSG